MDILNEKIEGLVNKAEKSKMPYGILKKVYDRGMAAWKTGHRPGTTPQQWAFARVNSFITKSSGTWGKADADLAKQVRGEQVENRTKSAKDILGQIREARYEIGFERGEVDMVIADQPGELAMIVQDELDSERIRAKVKSTGDEFTLEFNTNIPQRKMIKILDDKFGYTAYAESKELVKEKLSKNADAGDYIDDFKKSDAPQFKGKSDKKKEKMAVAAYLDSKEEVELEEGGVPARFGLSNSEKMKLAKDFDKLASDRTTSPNEKIYYKNTAKYFMDNMPDKAFNDMMGGAPEHIGGTIGRRTSAIIGKDKAKKVTGYKEEVELDEATYYNLERGVYEMGKEKHDRRKEVKQGYPNAIEVKSTVKQAADAVAKLNKEEFKEENCPKCDDDPCKCENIQEQNSLTASDKSKLVKHFDKLAKDYSLSPENQDAYKAVSDYIKMKTKRVDFDDVMKKTSAMHKQDIEIEMSRIIGKSKTKKVIESKEENIRESGHTDVASMKTQVQIAKDALEKMNMELGKLGDEEDLPTWWTNKVATAVGKLDGMADYINAKSQQGDNMSEAPRQLKDPKKETMVMKVKDAGSIMVIDKKDLQKYTSKGYIQVESNLKEMKNYKNEPNFFVNDSKDTLDKFVKRDGYGETEFASYLAQKTGKDPEDLYFDGNDLVYGSKTIVRGANRQTVDKLLAKLKTIRSQNEEVESNLQEKEIRHDGKGPIKMSKREYDKINKFRKGDIRGKPHVMATIKKGGFDYNMLVPVIFEEVDNITEETVFVIRFEKEGMRFATPFRRMQDAKDGEKILKKSAGVSNVSITKDILKPGIKFSEGIIVKEENLDEGKFTLPITHVIVDTRTNKVTHASSDDKGLKLDVGRKSHLKIVKLKKPKSQKMTGYLLGEPLKAWGEEVDDNSMMARTTRLISQTAIKEKLDPADIDMKATDLDRKAADKNIFIQLKRAQDMKGKTDVEFLDKKKQKVDIRVINKALDMFDKMKPNDKLKMQLTIGKSYRDLLKVVQRGKV